MRLASTPKCVLLANATFRLIDYNRPTSDMILVSRANSVGSAGVSYCSCSKLLPRDQYTSVIYCAPQTPCILVREIRRQSRASFWRIESAVAVHTNGSAFALWVWMKRSIFPTRSAVESKEPRRIARWVMRAKEARDLVEPGGVGRVK